jgi:hypothetical protein
MWADGATSLRWIWLPLGAKIDTTDPNNWVLPVGTKIWQELSILNKRIETRFLWKQSSSLWFRTTYAWSDDQTKAPQVLLGVPNARGLPYEIPAVSACEKCHGGANDFVLGFEGVGLSMATATGLNMTALKQQNLLSKPPANSPVIPGDPTTVGALAFLHTNCGVSCHNRNLNAQAGQTALFLKLLVDPSTGALPATAQQTDTWVTSYKVQSLFVPSGFLGDASAGSLAGPGPEASTPSPDAGTLAPVRDATTTVDLDATSPDSAAEAGAPPAPPAPTTTPAPTAPAGSGSGGVFYRIYPGDVAHSTINWRAGRRDGVTQMPPIATHVVDQADLLLLNTWVNALP